MSLFDVAAKGSRVPPNVDQDASRLSLEDLICLEINGIEHSTKFWKVGDEGRTTFWRASRSVLKRSSIPMSASRCQYDEMSCTIIRHDFRSGCRSLKPAASALQEESNMAGMSPEQDARVHPHRSASARAHAHHSSVLRAIRGPWP